MTSRLCFTLLLAMCLVGCKENPAKEAQKAMAPHLAKATAHVESLRKLAPAMAAAPRVTTEAVTLDAGPLKIGGPEDFDITAGFVSELDLSNLDSPHTKEPWRMPKANLFGVCGALLKGGGFVADHNKGRVAKNCADAKYVVVVRTLVRRAPVVNEEKKTFVAGEQSGEVRVWNLESGKDLGGFRFSARNDERVKTRISAISSIENDLAINLQVAIEAGLAKFVR